jgi:hypothetical protein
MLLQVIGQPPGTTKRGIGKPLKNAQRLEAYRHFFKGTWKAAGKYPNNTDTRWANIPIGWA